MAAPYASAVADLLGANAGPTDMGSLAFIALALVFAVVWVYVNSYFFYPLFRAGVLRLLGIGRRRVRYTAPIVELDDEELPTVDVLVPAYREGGVIDHAIKSISATDYPAEKRHITVLVEPDDDDTMTTLDRLAALYEFDVAVVPEAYPGDRNKPRALTYGHSITDGDVVGVVDAEDLVDPGVFRLAAGVLASGEIDYVQARIDAVNEDDGLLSMLYRGEYAFWYRYLMPNFQRAGYPMPLGGTTNFIPRDVLAAAATARVQHFGSPWSEAEREWLDANDLTTAAPWDPRNVTEDFELGLLLWQEQFRPGMLDSTTSEESPLDTHDWVNQRVRWQKGKLYTFRQYIRHPPRSPRAAFHVYTLSMTPHLGPINMLGIVLLMMYANLVAFRGSLLVTIVLLLGVLFALQRIVAHAFAYHYVTGNAGIVRASRTLVTMLTVPSYWLLEWYADVVAIRKLLAGDLTWEKSHHHGRHAGIRPLDLEVAVANLGGNIEFRVGDDGWIWRLRDGDGERVASSTDSHYTRLGARSEAATFFRTLAEGIHFDWADSAERPHFQVFQTDRGWSWRLRSDEAVLAVGMGDASSPGAAIDSADEFRTNSPTATLGTRRRSGPRGRLPEIPGPLDD